MARCSFPTSTCSPRALVRFQELTDKYSGKKTNWVLHKNSELGLEKQYFEYMAQGKAVDYGIVSPAHMSTFSKAAPFIDAPFLFRDLNHWNKVLDADLLKPVAEEIKPEGRGDADRLRGGGTRNIFVNKPVRNLQEMKASRCACRVRRSGRRPSRDRYGADRDRLQRGLQRHPERRHLGGENEAAGRADEVLRGGAGSVDDAARDHHPADLLLAKTFNKLDKNMQAAILKAGKEAGAYGRKLESSEDEAKLIALEKAGKLKRVPLLMRDLA